MSDNGLSFDIAPTKGAVYAACNNVFSHPRGGGIIQLSLQKTYCLSVMLYASPARYLKPKQLSELKVRWNSICRKFLIFSKR